ncbi:hypothetical protein N7592_11750 [Pseudomonas juntendi]|uniref:Uncharacterized protein n=1 Tax=Pseudomonas juntendi TaxID=2666183 RepID=A0ABZ2JAE7_9PSED|nr:MULTISPECIES: hypothetical protein [Pseudomonas]MDG9873862.1 hypothetical protein [Pseudomonas juntendi]MDH2013942.1 hypothetical protein [Pseudomonas juntendi]QDR69820.1 hypothetical protein FPB55_20490 [Pseudomonas sp. BJP69]
MRRPFEMFHETLGALKRIDRQLAMLLIIESSRSKRLAETKKGANAHFDSDDVAGTPCGGM